MAVTKHRVAEVVEYFLQYGEQKTCETFGIDSSTLSRYRRLYKQHFGENADLLMKIKSLYSTEELAILAEGGKKPVSQKQDLYLNFSGEEYVAGIISDTHLGSIYTDESVFPFIFAEMEKQGCQAIFHAGDISEGMMGRANSVYELCDIGFVKQRDKCISILSQWKKDWYIIDGNHDDSFNTKLGAGISMGREIAAHLSNVHYLGNGHGDVYINGIRISLYHGNDGGSSYALSYRIQKIIEALASKNKPHICITGHDHKAFYLPMYRNVQGIASGCIQKQTPYMISKRSAAHTGFWIMRFTAANSSLLSFNVTWYPIYI